MTRAVDLSHVDHWVFDLDNTLYPAHCDLFAQIDVRMTEFVARELKLDHNEARAIQKAYYAEYGTTLNGLMTRHAMEPADFLDYVHDIDLTPIDHAPDLEAAIARLPGEKFIYTNGSRGHAERVSAKLGLAHLFDGVFAIEDSSYTPKPHRQSFEHFVRSFGVAPEASIMFEDLPRNLTVPADMGFTTVLVTSQKDWSHEPANARPASPTDGEGDHIHHVTDCLTTFLSTATHAKR